MLLLLLMMTMCQPVPFVADDDVANDVDAVRVPWVLGRLDNDAVVAT